MSVERFLTGVGSGLAASYIGGALDSRRAKEGADGLAEVAFSTSAITTLCVIASVYLEMPALVPIIISSFARASYESYKFYVWVREKLEGE